MSALLLGALVGLSLSVAYYLGLARGHSRSARNLGRYFFDGWSLDERMVGVSQFSSSMSLATVVIALMQLAAVFGLALSWATITFCVGWLIFAAAVPNIRSKTIPRDTIHSFLGRAYDSPALRAVASAATILGFMGLFSTELLAADTVFTALGVPKSWIVAAIVVFGLVTMAYSAVGGFRSVVRSDWSQTALLSAAMAVLGILAVRVWVTAGQPPFHGNLGVHSFSLPLALAISLFFINVPYPFVDTQAWQRARAAASDRAASVGTAKAVALFAVSWTFLIVLGTALAAFMPQGSDPFQSLVASAFTLPAVLAALVGFLLVPGLLAAMFSSADAFINSAAHVYSLDLSTIRNKNESDDVWIVARRHVLTIGLLSLAACLLLRSVGFGIIDLVFSVSAGQIALLPAVSVALLSRGPGSLRRLSFSALVSIIAGFAAAWANGLYSVLVTGRLLHPSPGLLQVVPADVYRSPAYAFAVSVAAYAAASASSLLFTRTSKVTRG
jgi:Na+/proline symporter